MSANTTVLPGIRDLFPDHLFEAAQRPRSATSSPHSSPLPTFRSLVLSPDSSPMSSNMSLPSEHESPRPLPSATPRAIHHRHRRTASSPYPIRIIESPDRSYSESERDYDSHKEDQLEEQVTVTKPAKKDNRRHVCPHCGKRFNRPSSLKIHVNTHTGAKPFECPFPGCGRNFNVSSNMRRHFRNHSSSISSTASSASASVTSSPAIAAASLPASPRMPAQPSPALSASSSGTTYTTSSESYISSRERSLTPSDNGEGVDMDVVEVDIRNSSLSYTRSTAIASYTFPSPSKPLSGKRIPTPLPLAETFRFKRIDF